MICRRRPVQSHNAHYPTSVRVQYRWHPLFGKDLIVKQTCRHKEEVYYIVQVADGTSALLPAWMADEAVCSGLRLGSPCCSLAALRSLRDMLQSCPWFSESPYAKLSSREAFSKGGTGEATESSRPEGVPLRRRTKNMGATAPRYKDKSVGSAGGDDSELLLQEAG